MVEVKRVDRRGFLSYAVTAVVVGVVAGVGGYYAGLGAPGGAITTTTSSTTTVTGGASTTTVTAGASTTTVTAPRGTTTFTQTTTVTPKPPIDRIVIAFPEEIGSLDPHLAASGMGIGESVWGLLYDSILYVDRNQVVQPNICELPTYSPDKLTQTLRVRKGHMAHDGSEITAVDVKDHFDRIMGPEARYSAMFNRYVQGVEIEDDYTLKVSLKSYDPTFCESRYAIAWGNITPKKPLDALGLEEFFKKPIGTGPYKFVRYTPGVLELEAFEEYWKGPPPIKRVIIKEARDPSTRAAEVEAGSSDFTLAVDLADYDRLAGLPELKGMSATTVEVVMFHVSPYFEPFGDKNVRLALHHAIDKESIVKNVILGFGTPLSTCLAPTHRGFNYLADYKFPYDPDEAKNLLGKAGYDSGNPLKFKMFAIKGRFARDYEVALAVAEMWRKVGVQPDVEVVTFAQMADLRKVGKLAPITITPWSGIEGDPANTLTWQIDPMSIFSAYGGQDFPEFTGLKEEIIERVKGVRDFSKSEADRYKYGAEFAKWVSEESMIIPLYLRHVPYIMKKNLQYEPDPKGPLLVNEMRFT